jgi:predicted glutamine amidotransferase
MSGGPDRVAASFWLLEAPDSLSEQSRREPDGTGLGYYDQSGRPVVDKQPIAAFEDRAFAREARKVHSRTFVAHVRFASTGASELQNTHPFEQRGRLLAHNGVIENLPALEAELGDAMREVQGDTDSERLFALITREIDAAGGDVGEGIARAARWVAANLPIYALNVVLITSTDLWALRYPDTHDLFVLECDPRPGGDLRSGTVRVASPEQPSVVVASEKMDDDRAWRPLESGQLVHVGADLKVQITDVVPDPPAHLISLADLDPRAASSQHP